MNADDFLALKDKVDRLKQEYHKASGSLDTLLDHLANDYGAEDLEEAKSKLKQLDRKSQQLNKKHNALLTKFEDKWADLLSD